MVIGQLVEEERRDGEFEGEEKVLSTMLYHSVEFYYTLLLLAFLYFISSDFRSFQLI